MADTKMMQATFSGSMNQGLQMGQNLGTVNTTFSISEGANVYMSGSSAPSSEDQFLDALMGGDTSIGVQIEAPEPGTCSWILPELRAWQTGPLNRPLWISGSAGCGKSVISSFILKEKSNWITSKEETKGKIIVAGSFADRHPNRQKPVWVLRTLLYEIFKQNRDLIDTKDPDFWQESGDPEHPILNPDSFESLEPLVKLLAQVTNNEKISEVYLVIDGQYQQTQDALDLFIMVSQVSSNAGSSALPRWIFSTRPNSIDRLLQNVEVIDLFEKNRGDIRIVAKSRMTHFQRLNPAMTESFIDEVVEILTRRAEGMFLWLSLALKSLGDGTIWDIDLVKEKLQTIPYDVQAIYGTIFENIDKKMQTLLRWVDVAGRPLKVDEVLVMWALQDGAKSTDEITKRSLRPEIVKGSLESGLKALLALHDDGSIHLAHPSVKDFIRQLYSNSGKGQGNQQITISETHKQIAELCVSYLSLDEIQKLKAPDPPVDENGIIDREKREKEVEQYLGEYHFLEYSIMFLGLHLRESEKESVHVNIQGIDDFFGGKTGALNHWVRGYDLLVRCTRDTGGTSSLSLLFISARLNLTSLAEHFISTGSALTSLINLPGMKTLAGGASSFAMVRAQVVNLPDIKGWRALHVAADSEAEEVVTWLLDNRAAVDSETIGIIRPGRTALHFAASKSSETALRIVQKLLEKGANPAIPTRFGGNTPLHYAVQGGSVDMLKLLLDRPKQKNADPNIANYSGITALHKAAAIPGFEEGVEVLLQHGANPELVSSIDKVAVVRGVRDANVTATLKAVASMETAAMWKTATDVLRGIATNQTALHKAVRVKGTEETVKKLLKWYVDNEKAIEIKDSRGYTPLHSAVEGPGASTHTKLLLDSKKVDVKAQDNDGRTPLMLFLRRLGQSQLLSNPDDPAALKTTLDDLLDSSAALDIQDNDGKTAVDYAKQTGVAWAVEKLNAVLPPPESPKVDLNPAPEPQPEPAPQSIAGGAANMVKKRLNMFSKKSWS